MKRIFADAAGLNTFIEKHIDCPGVTAWTHVNVVLPATRAHERHWARIGWRPHTCCMGKHGTRVSIAFTVWCLIKDYHSPMDAWPRHAAWDAVY